MTEEAFGFLSIFWILSSLDFVNKWNIFLCFFLGGFFNVEFATKIINVH